MLEPVRTVSGVGAIDIPTNPFATPTLTPTSVESKSAPTTTASLAIDHAADPSTPIEARDGERRVAVLLEAGQPAPVKPPILPPSPPAGIQTPAQIAAAKKKADEEAAKKKAAEKKKEKKGDKKKSGGLKKTNTEDEAPVPPPGAVPKPEDILKAAKSKEAKERSRKLRKKFRKLTRPPSRTNRKAKAFLNSLKRFPSKARTSTKKRKNKPVLSEQWLRKIQKKLEAVQESKGDKKGDVRNRAARLIAKQISQVIAESTKTLHKVNKGKLSRKELKELKAKAKAMKRAAKKIGAEAKAGLIDPKTGKAKKGGKKGKDAKPKFPPPLKKPFNYGQHLDNPRHSLKKIRARKAAKAAKEAKAIKEGKKPERVQRKKDGGKKKKKHSKRGKKLSRKRVKKMKLAAKKRLAAKKLLAKKLSPKKLAAKKNPYLAKQLAAKKSAPVAKPVLARKTAPLPAPAAKKPCTQGCPRSLMEADSEAEVETETDADADAEGETETEADSELDAESDAESELAEEDHALVEAESDAEMEVDADADAELDAESEGETELDADADADTEAEAEAEIADRSHMEVSSELPPGVNGDGHDARLLHTVDEIMKLDNPSANYKGQVNSKGQLCPGCDPIVYNADSPLSDFDKKLLRQQHSELALGDVKLHSQSTLDRATLMIDDADALKKKMLDRYPPADALIQFDFHN